MAALPFYKIAFRFNGSSQAEQEIVSADPVTLPTPNSWYGHTFNGWFTDSSGGSKVGDAGGTYFPPSGTPNNGGPMGVPIYIYAQWTSTQYTLTFDSQGGSAVTSYTQYSVTQITLPTPSWAGHTFQGWFAASTGGSPVPSTYTLNASATLYAQWTINRYRVTYDYQNSSGDASSFVVNAGTAITLQDPQLFAGHAFVEWNTASDGSGTAYAVGISYVVNSNITFYDRWTTLQYTLTYDSQGGSVVAPNTQNAGTQITLPTSSWAGHTFQGWFAEPTGGSPVASTYTLNASATLYAQWTTQTYRITYDSRGGSAVASDTEDVGVPAVIAAGPTPPLDWTFGRWNTQPDGSGIRYNVGSSYSRNANITLYAQWSVAIAYDTLGGPNILGTIVSPGSVIRLAGTPTLAGYIFLKWNTMSDGTGTSYDAGSQITLNQNQTLYAQWAGKTTIVSLTFDSQGGSAVWPMLAAPGSFVRLPADPVRPGYIFLGWYSTPSNGQKVPSRFVLNEYMTVYAYWEDPVSEVSLSTSSFVRNCPPLRTGTLLFPRTRQLPRCCPPPVYSMTSPTVDLNGIVRFVSSYPMYGTDMYRILVNNHQPANLQNTYSKYYKNSGNGYDSGVLAFPGVPFSITVIPYQDGIPRTSYTIPFTSLPPQAPLLLTATQSGVASVFLQWLVPESDQYVPSITSYIIRYGATTLTTTTNALAISGLTPGTYTFTVQAQNMAGLGIISTPVDVTL